MKNQEQPMEKVQPLLLDHQSAEWPIGHVGTMEESGLVENMQAAVSSFYSFLKCFNQTILNSVGENLSLINHRLIHHLSHHVLK
jgi:hypothetical protein